MHVCVCMCVRVCVRVYVCVCVRVYVCVCQYGMYVDAYLVPHEWLSQIDLCVCVYMFVCYTLLCFHACVVWGYSVCQGGVVLSPF